MKTQWRLTGILFLLMTIGCAQTTSTTIAGSTYQVSQNSIVQTKSAFLDDNVIKIGVVSDIEGAIAGSREIAGKFQGQNLDMIIIAGDVYENEQIRRNPVYPASTDNVKEMVDGISHYAALGLPIFVIPGNHETRAAYAKGLVDLREKHDNVFDLSVFSVDAQGANIVGIGGYHDADFIAQGGFQISGEEYSRAEKTIAEFARQNEPIILVTHSPPKTGGRVDYVEGAGNVGDSRINELLSGSKVINVHGHIHEGGGNTAAVGNSTAINVASITAYNNPNAPGAAIITIRNGIAEYKFIR